MKKFIISAVMALLLGGFAFTANAQDEDAKTVKQTAPKPKLENVEKSKADNSIKIKLDNMLNEYESAVKECLSIYKGENTQDKTSLDAKIRSTLTLKASIEKEEKNLTPAQLKKFKTITESFNKVLTKK